MLTKYTSRNGVQYLMTPGHGIFPGGNLFTVIVGKNGTGKSRMLRNIALNFLKDDVPPDAFEREERARILSAERYTVDAHVRPSKIICASASPFDRFPLLRRNESILNYSYLGLRGLSTNNLSLSYMSRVMAALIGSVFGHRSRLEGIANILEYLGYQPVFKASFFLGVGGKLLDSMFSSQDPASILRESFLRPQSFPTTADSAVGFKLFQEASRHDMDYAIDVLSVFRRRKIKPRVDVVLHLNGIEVSSELNEKDVMVLLRCGLLRLKDVEMFKQNETEPIRIAEASSGEQSVVMSLLGIGSQIEDGALICIDEPEVCLHPEWQERYIHLLTSTFQGYRGCHFLIATHSPQIVAELPNTNCFVTNMETKEIYSGKDVYRKSIDFQLANVFDTPGFGNEYLNRIALSTFLKIGKNKLVDQKDRENFEILDRLYDRMDESDPLKDLVVALRELFVKYG